MYWTGFMKAALFDYSYINVGSLNAVIINVPFQHQKVSHPTLGALQGGFFFWGGDWEIKATFPVCHHTVYWLGFWRNEEKKPLFLSVYWLGFLFHLRQKKKTLILSRLKTTSHYVWGGHSTRQPHIPLSFTNQVKTYHSTCAFWEYPNNNISLTR